MSETLRHARAAAAAASSGEKRAAFLRGEHERLTGRLVDRKKELEKEGRDVTKLEGLSLKALFHTVLGDKGQQLEKERQEYLSAKLAHDQAAAEIAALDTEIAGLERAAPQRERAREDYERQLAAEEQAVRASGGPRGDAVARLRTRSEECHALLREIDEAESAARRALRALDAVHDALASAGRWGTWDLLGGGFLATAVKHSRLDDARTNLVTAQRALRDLARELSDVDLRRAPDIDVGGFLTFADYFFDGLISDWIVQSRIRDSEAHVERTVRDVHRAEGLLRARRDKVQEELARMEREYEDELAR